MLMFPKKVIAKAHTNSFLLSPKQTVNTWYCLLESCTSRKWDPKTATRATSAERNIGWPARPVWVRPRDDWLSQVSAKWRSLAAQIIHFSQIVMTNDHNNWLQNWFRSNHRSQIYSTSVILGILNKRKK